MKSRFLIILFLVLLAIPHGAGAQVFTPIAAKEILPQVTAKAQTDLAADARLTATLFAGVSYQGLSLTMSPSTGKATGWIYRMYSPSLDSALFFVGVKIPILGAQIVKITMDTLSRHIPVSVEGTELAEPWVDSPEALEGAKTGGAAAFLQTHPDATVALALAVNNPIANPVLPQGSWWLLRFASALDTLTCAVNALTAQPLQCRSNNGARITGTPTTSAKVGSLYQYDVDATGTPPPTFQLLTHPAGMTIDATTGLITWTPDASQTGNQDVTVRAENSAGFDDQSFTIVVTGDGTVPRITSTPTLEAVASQAWTYQIQAEGEPTPMFRLLTQPATMLLDAGRGRLIWTPTRAQVGEHQVSVQAYNSAGTDTQSFLLTVLTIPQFGIVPPQTAIVGEPYRYTVSVDAVPSPTFQLVQWPEGMTIDAATGTLTWTPGTTQTGTHTVSVQAANRAGSKLHSFTIDVSTSSDVPTLPEAAGFSILSLHPNPVGGGQTVLATIRADRELTADAEVVDVSGRLLSRTPLRLLPGDQILRLETTELPAGAYLLRLRSAGAAVTWRLVVRENR